MNKAFIMHSLNNILFIIPGASAIKFVIFVKFYELYYALKFQFYELSSYSYSHMEQKSIESLIV